MEHFSTPLWTPLRPPQGSPKGAKWGPKVPHSYHRLYYEALRGLQGFCVKYSIPITGYIMEHIVCCHFWL